MPTSFVIRPLSSNFVWSSTGGVLFVGFLSDYTVVRVTCDNSNVRDDTHGSFWWRQWYRITGDFKNEGEFMTSLSSFVDPPSMLKAVRIAEPDIVKIPNFYTETAHITTLDAVDRVLLEIEED